MLWDVAVHGGLQLAGQAPLVANGKLIVARQTSRDGFIQAYDAETGKYRWTWRAIPEHGRSRPGELGRPEPGRRSDLDRRGPTIRS